MKSYEEEVKALKEDIMRDRYALRNEAIARENQEKKEKNIFYKIVKKLLTLFK